VIFSPVGALADQLAPTPPRLTGVQKANGAFTGFIWLRHSFSPLIAHRPLPDRAPVRQGLGDEARQERPVDRIEVISSGSLGLDIALGVGGLPKGRVIEIYGPESSGKTTLALHCAAEAQKKGGICAFVDAEHALDPVYARKLGVNLSTNS
jgi:hypothetical protein